MSNRSHPSLLTVAAQVARLERPVILVLSVAAGFFTFRGAAAIEPDADWLAKGGCAMLALAVAVGLYFMWRALLALVPLLPSLRRWLAVPIIVLTCGFAVGISSYFNLVGMIAPEAMQRHMEAVLAQSSDALSLARSQADRGLADVSVLRLNYPKFSQLAEAERVRGGTSGADGNGAIASMLGQVATVMGSALQQVEKQIKAAGTLTAESEAHLATMRQLVADPGLSLPTKVQRFGTEAESLRLKLLQLSQLEAASIIGQAVTSAQEMVKPALSANRAIAARQQTAIDQLTELLSQLGSLKKAAGTHAASPFLGGSYQSITVYTAVLQHIPDFIPAALAALLIDLTMLPILLLNILVHAGRDTLSVARRYTVAEMIEVRDLMVALQQPAAPLLALPPPSPLVYPPPRHAALANIDDRNAD